MKTQFLTLDDVLMKSREVSSSAMKNLTNAITKMAESNEYPKATQEHALDCWTYLATQVDQLPLLSTTIELITTMENLIVLLPSNTKDASKFFTSTCRAAYCVHEAMEGMKSISSDVSVVIASEKFDSISADLSRATSKLTSCLKKSAPPSTKAFTEAFGQLAAQGVAYFKELGLSRVAKNKDKLNVSSHACARST